MGNPPFEYASPKKNDGFPASYVSLPEGKYFEVSSSRKNLKFEAFHVGKVPPASHGERSNQ